MFSLFWNTWPCPERCFSSRGCFCLLNLAIGSLSFSLLHHSRPVWWNNNDVERYEYTLPRPQRDWVAAGRRHRYHLHIEERARESTRLALSLISCLYLQTFHSVVSHLCICIANQCLEMVATSVRSGRRNMPRCASHTFFGKKCSFQKKGRNWASVSSCEFPPSSPKEKSITLKSLFLFF